MTFEEFGQLLKSEREKRNLGLDTVSEELKINSRILAALEAGDMAKLPGPAYAKGFIRTYASFLGLSNEEIRSILDEITPSKNIPISGTSHSTPPEKRKEKGSHKGSPLFLWVLLFICVAGAGGYWAWTSEYFKLLEGSQTDKIDSIEKLPDADTWQPPREMPAQENRPEPVPSPMSLPEHLQQTSQPPKEETSIPSNGEEVKITDEKESNEDKPAITEETPTHHKLIITATEECWVHSRSDKTDTRQFSLRKGDTFALTFARELELKLGNAGGVHLRYDGKDLPPAGTSGQVKTIIFPPKDN